MVLENRRKLKFYISVYLFVQVWGYSKKSRGLSHLFLDVRFRGTNMIGTISIAIAKIDDLYLTGIHGGSEPRTSGPRTGPCISRRGSGSN